MTSHWYDDYVDSKKEKTPDSDCFYLGLAGEAGEVCDIRKKVKYHLRHELKKKMLNELGDTLFYLTAIAHDNGYTLIDVMMANKRKLDVRYPDGHVPGGGNRTGEGA